VLPPLFILQPFSPLVVGQIKERRKEKKMEFRFEEDFDESRVGVLVISLISVLVRVFDFMTAAALCTLHLLHWLTVCTFFIFKAAAGSS